MLLKTVDQDADFVAVFPPGREASTFD